METSHAWLGLLLLGALHGINPGMGWLFAVALGLQERRAAAVWSALGPLAAGHALAIAAAILVASLAGVLVPLEVLKWGVAALLLALGGYKLLRAGHPRWAGMRVGARELTIWSFLMASAHGAGLMVLPLFLGVGTAGPIDAGRLAVAHAHAAHAIQGAPASRAEARPLEHASGIVMGQRPVEAGSKKRGSPTSSIASDVTAGLAVTLAHTLGYLLVTALAALIVYGWLGLRLLRSLWFNLDRAWAIALIMTALLTPLL